MRLIRDLSGSEIGRKVLSAAREGTIELEVSSAVVERNLLGESIGKVALAYARNTQSYSRTAEILVHEGVHSLGVGGSRRAEALARLAEIMHRGGTVDRAAIRTVIEDMNAAGVYNDLPWRLGETSPNFPDVTF